MPIDINEFIQAFVDEGLEMLQGIEKSILHLDLEALDRNDINFIFRSMHSLKGNSAVFGFNLISDFSHTLESFLDQVRSGKQHLTQQHINLLLKSIDRLRVILMNIQNKVPLDNAYVKDLDEFFKNQLLPSAEEAPAPIIEKKVIEKEPRREKKPEIKPEVTGETRKPPELVEKEKIAGWFIVFHPNRNILQAGNEPSRLFSVLADLGKLDIKVDMSDLPEFPHFDPTECYLTWQLKLYCDVPKKEIQEIFKWVANEENVTILEIESAPEKKPTHRYFIQAEKEELPTEIQYTSVRVNTEKIDALINIVGELVITESMLAQIVKGFEMGRLNNLYEGLEYLENNLRILQECVMRIRMVPIEFIFNRIPRLIHDLAQKMRKEIELIIMGEKTELDKNMMEKLGDPLLHLVRNAMDHGIEPPEERIKKGKPSRGTIQLTAYQEGSSIVIDTSDDGAGLDKEKIKAKAIASGLLAENEEINEDKIYQLIFKAGFSTAGQLTDVSGRGVGLDVVYKNIIELGGEIDVITYEGKGTTFRIRLPLTLAIMECQLVKIDTEVYIIPLMVITENQRIDMAKVNRLDKETTLYYFRNHYIPVIYLAKIFNIPNGETNLENKFLIVVDVENQLYGLVVDEVLSQQRVVIKNLEDNFKPIDGIYGVTILGDGHIALIIDVKSVIDMALDPKRLLEKKKTRVLTKMTEIQPPPEEKISNEQDPNKLFQFLSFMMVGQEYGIDILSVKEIRPWEKTTILPNTAPYIKGVINVRGTIIPIIDLRERFELKPYGYGPQTAIIILLVKFHRKYRQMGIVIDRISNTYTIRRNEIMSAPENTQSKLRDHIRGLVTINDKMITLLSIDDLISVALEKENAS